MMCFMSHFYGSVCKFLISPMHSRRFIISPLIYLSYREKPFCILDEDVRQTRHRKIKFYKVQWTNHTPKEATWEREEYLRTEFPDFLPTQE